MRVPYKLPSGGVILATFRTLDKCGNPAILAGQGCGEIGLSLKRRVLVCSGAKIAGFCPGGLELTGVDRGTAFDREVIFVPGMCVTRTLRALSLLLMLLPAGCLNPMTTRLPQLGWDEPRVARRNQERFDPYPLPDLGPETFTRQRDAAIPRTPSRRLNDQLLINKFGEVPTSTPQAERTYPQAVRE